jgi:hypothetical protein
MVRMDDLKNIQVLSNGRVVYKGLNPIWPRCMNR